MKKLIVSLAALAAIAAHAGGFNWGGAAAAMQGYEAGRTGQPLQQRAQTPAPAYDNAGGIAASFTGNMEQVQTVSGLYAWRCEYLASGQRFFRIFRDSCPGIIHVQ
jgi:hypothetical protein